jgi:hypothetical protein
MAKTKTYTAIVADRSGSMHKIKDEAQGGIRGFIDKLAVMTEVKNLVTLYEFDSVFAKVFGPVKAEGAPEYVLEPRGMTALYDAVGLAIEDSKKIIGALPDKDKPDKVALVIMTDGEENQSKEHTFESVQNLVADRQGAGWQIVFLAGTLEAREFARASGIAHNTFFDPHKVGSTRSVYGEVATAAVDFYAGETSSIVVPDSVSGDEEEKK